ncbi:hypothetical protein N431DRAFT_429553 [Stipitochalara longipes BDJ]|nr:hypothetical protein N431DRAFT_429553 [Stipitochalara longipes BDJ]
MIPVFVDGLNREGPVRVGTSRAHHQKSRTGCQRCKSRRVKCNEAKPICRNCERHGVCCTYDRYDPAPKNGTESGSNTAVEDSQSLEADEQLKFRDGDPSRGWNANYTDTRDQASRDSPSEPPESKRRRMLELELMHFYVTETGPSIAFDKNISSDLFVKAIPRFALKSNSLLYSVYAIATLHQVKTTGGSDPSIPSPTAVATARDHHQLYLQLAFHHHHQELTQLSRANVDMVMMTANVLRLIAFVVLSERPLVPYLPPLEWLRITRSHGQVFRAAWDLVGDDSSTQTARLIRAHPVVWDPDEREGADKREGLQHLLLACRGVGGCPEDEPGQWDDGMRRAYESTLSYIGGIWHSVQKNDPLGPIGRRLMLFPILIDQRFIELVGEARPRALVIMAHYFALFVVLKSYWIVGNTGPREVRAIAAQVSADWQGMMALPLHLVNQGVLYSPAAAT